MILLRHTSVLKRPVPRLFQPAAAVHARHVCCTPALSSAPSVEHRPAPLQRIFTISNLLFPWIFNRYRVLISSGPATASTSFALVGKLVDTSKAPDRHPAPDCIVVNPSVSCCKSCLNPLLSSAAKFCERCGHATSNFKGYYFTFCILSIHFKFTFFSCEVLPKSQRCLD